MKFCAGCKFSWGGISGKKVCAKCFDVKDLKGRKTKPKFQKAVSRPDYATPANIFHVPQGLKN